MKKSFFSRAIASAAVIPLALTQCLTFSSYAVDDSDPASTPALLDEPGNTTLSIKSLVSVDPEAEAFLQGTADNGNEIYKQISDWNATQALPLLYAAEGNSADIDVSAVENIAVASAGRYAEIVSKLFAEVDTVNAKINKTDVTFTASVNDISVIIADEAQNRINNEIKSIKDSYPQVDFTKLETVDFNALGDISGTLEFVVDMSNIEESTRMPVTYTITTSDGQVLTLTGENNLFDYVVSKYEVAKKSVTDAADELFADVKAQLDDADAKLQQAEADVAEAQAKLDEIKASGADTSEAQAELDAKKAELAAAEAEYADAMTEYKAAGADASVKIENAFKRYDNKIGEIKTNIDEYTSYSTNGTKEYATTADALKAAKNFFANKNSSYAKKIAAKIPVSATAALTSANGSKAFDDAVTQMSKLVGKDINVSAAEAGAFIDSFTDVKVDAATGVWTINAKFADDADEAAVAKAYMAKTYGKTVEETWKEITVTVDTNAASTGSGYVQVDIERYLVVTTTVTTTTTTTVSTTTTTTTTGDVDNDTTTTTTTTGDVDNDTTTTTTTGDVDNDTTTTTTTTGDVDNDTTTTTTTTGDVDNDTTTTTTTTGDVDNDTTTTTTTTGDVDNDTTTTTTGDVDNDTTTTTTTTSYVVSSYVKTVQCAEGYYFSHDNRGFSRDQITKVEMEYVMSDGTIQVKDVTSQVDFGTATPENTYKRANVTFTYDVPLYIGKTPLTYNDKKPATVTAYIGVKGDADLNNEVDSLDASAVLTYYANVQVSPTQDKSIKLTQDDPKLDNLAAFLSDCDASESDPANYSRVKTVRTLDALDASYILTFYADKQTSTQDTSNVTVVYDIWNKVVPGMLITRK